MRGLLCIAVIFALLPAAYAETALQAVKQLPPGQAARIARIEGRDGSPDPDRWYILTQDSNADNGVHEFVISNGKVVASRSISQFADNLKPEDILNSLPSIDSNKAARLARDYALANSATAATISYELKSSGTGAPALWTISCLDDKGARLGSLVLTAGKGSVVSHDGFPLEPQPAPTLLPTPTPIPRKKQHHYLVQSRPPQQPSLVDAPPTEYLYGTGHNNYHPTPRPSPNPVSRFGQTLEKILPF